MQFETEVELWVARTPRDLLERVRSQRIHATEPAEALGETRHFVARPIVFGPDLVVLVVLRWPVRVSKLIGDRQHHGATNSSIVQESNEVVRGDRLEPRNPRGRRWAEQMLMMIAQRGRLAVKPRQGRRYKHARDQAELGRCGHASSVLSDVLRLVRVRLATAIQLPIALSGLGGARIPASRFSDRPGNECLEDLDVEVRQSLEVQTGLTHPVPSELGQEVDLLGAICDEVDD